MICCQKQSLDAPDAVTGRNYRWTVELEDQRVVPWQGLQTGPLTLSPEQVDETCRLLLGLGVDSLQETIDRILKPAVGAMADRPAVILHSTTPELRTFEGDLDALARERRGGDFTTYKEARSVYLAQPGDLAVGRTQAWKAAVQATGAEAIELEDVDHYYLSHCLLHLARQYAEGRNNVAQDSQAGCAVARLIAHVRETPRLIRLYAFELEMQIFLLWLAKAAGLEELAVEANRPALSAAWNRKEVLHPTVARAIDLKESVDGMDPKQCLQLESKHCALAERLELNVPTIPGYSIERPGRSVEDFVRQTSAAAELLTDRYGLELGCLKASESGDGARITPGIDLKDVEGLSELAREAHVHGDDYVLEAHVYYGQAEISGQVLPTALSAHVRGGRVAAGATIQFMEGTSWKGNVLLDEKSVELFSIPGAHYEELCRFVDEFRDGFERKDPGLVLAGVDFAIGRVAGLFGDSLLLGVQDLNVSFTGAECLRAFLSKASREKPGDDAHAYGVTRIYRPKAHADHHAFLEVTRTLDQGLIFADTVAAIPGRWGMVGITGTDPRDAIDNLNRLQAALLAAGLIEQP